jgi:hypothetical protein
MLKENNKNHNHLIRILCHRINNIKGCIDLLKKFKKKLLNN